MEDDFGLGGYEGGVGDQDEAGNYSGGDSTGPDDSGLDIASLAIDDTNDMVGGFDGVSLGGDLGSFLSGISVDDVSDMATNAPDMAGGFGWTPSQGRDWGMGIGGVIGPAGALIGGLAGYLMGHTNPNQDFQDRDFETDDYGNEIALTSAGENNKSSDGGAFFSPNNAEGGPESSPIEATPRFKLTGDSTSLYKRRKATEDKSALGEKYLNDLNKFTTNLF